MDNYAVQNIGAFGIRPSLLDRLNGELDQLNERKAKVEEAIKILGENPDIAKVVDALTSISY